MIKLLSMLLIIAQLTLQAAMQKDVTCDRPTAPCEIHKENNKAHDPPASWPSKQEVSQLTIALTLKHPLSGGVVKHEKQTYKTERKHEKITVGLPYYKWMLKELNNTKKPLNTKKTIIKNLVNNYPKNLMVDKKLLKKTWSQFQAIPGQRSWVEWLNTTNKPHMVMMFYYLINLEENLDTVLKKTLGLKKVKAMKAKRIVSIIKKQACLSKKAPNKKRKKRILKRSWPTAKDLKGSSHSLILSS